MKFLRLKNTPGKIFVGEKVTEVLASDEYFSPTKIFPDEVFPDKVVTLVLEVAGSILPPVIFESENQ